MRRLLQFVLFTSFPAICYSQLQVSAQATVCAAQSAAAVVTASVNNATIYNWAINPQESIMPGGSASNTLVNISFTACGSHTLTCDAYNGTAFLSSISKTINVICPGVTVTPVTQTICAGSIATLVASGAGSYTWSNSQATPTINPAPVATAVYSVIGNVNSCLGTATVNITNTPTIISTANAVCANYSSTLLAFGSSSYTWTGSSITNPIIQPTIAVGPGSYTVSSLPGSAACSTNITISLAPPLNITYALSTNTTCIIQNSPNLLSKPVIITASGASTYSWTPSGPSPTQGPVITVRPATSTCYTVTGFTSLCSGSAVACVSVMPQFSFDIISIPGAFCKNLYSTMTIVNIGNNATGPTSGFNYYWNFNTNFFSSLSNLNAPTILLIPLVTNTYSVEMSDAQNCMSAQKQGTMYVLLCDFLPDLSKSPENQNDLFNLFPNPAGESIFLKEKNTSVNNLTIELTDPLGKKILIKDLQLEIVENSWRLDLKDIAKGIYFVKLFSDGQLLQESKVIKQ